MDNSSEIEWDGGLLCLRTELHVMTIQVRMNEMESCE